MTAVLPKKKRELLRYLKEYIAKHGYAPTLTEIAEKFQVKSLATVHEHLAFLEKAGYVKLEKGNVRNMTILDPDADDVYEEAASVSLPLIGLITAGKPIEAIEEHDTMVSVPEEIVRRKNAFLLKVKGDSMVESLIADGDYVVVEKTSFAKDGDMVVALLEDGTATLKKFYKQKNFIRLQPANKKYKPLVVKSVVIQGKVLGVIRKVAP